jgi:hypothetical protein
MIVKLTPEFKFVCDRCGREQFPNKEGYIEASHRVEFNEKETFRPMVKKGEVCTECANEFWEFANNFFDEANKETEDTE